MKFILRKNIDEQRLTELTERTGLERLTVKLLMMRDIDTPQAISSFLSCDINDLSSPLDFPDMKKAVDLINHTIKQNLPIVLYGDYDCDGIGGISILYLALKELNANVHYYIPQRHEEGYGLNIEAIDKIIRQYSPKLLITVDCGITSVKETEYLKKKGIAVIITDHHEPSGDIPDAPILNPALNGGANPLCGAGVALKLVEMLTSRDNMRKYIDICAVSTVADIVPLTGDNRTIVKEGLDMLSSRKCRESLKKLMAVSGIKKDKEVSVYDLAFRIAPRINACGRLSSASKALKLLIEDDPTAIALLAEELDRENKKRQDIFSEVLTEALNMLETYDFSRNLIIALSSSNWEEGVIGIAASKLAEQFNRPAILFTENDGIMKGSARSIQGVNIFEVIRSCKDLLIRFGGHSMAAGLSLRKENLNTFIERVNEYIKQNTDKSCFEKKIIYDEEINIGDINADMIKLLKLLEPFGCGNPKPLFITKARAMNFSRIGNYTHIKNKMKNFKFIAFNGEYALPLLNGNTEKIISFGMDRDIFRNKEYIQCVIKDIYADKAHVDEDILFARYLSAFTHQGKRKDIIKKAPMEGYGFGNLYVAFTNKAFNAFNNDCYERLIFNTPALNPYDSIILSPEKDFIYTYYNKIVFLEAPPASMIDFIKENFCGKIEVTGKSPVFNIRYDFDIDGLRKDYLFFAQNLNNTAFRDIGILYKTAVMKGYTKTFCEFAVSFHIFMELELLSINNSGTINLHNKKTDLNKSEIYKWLSEAKTNKVTV